MTQRFSRLCAAVLAMGILAAGHARAQTAEQRAPGTVSIDILRHPVTEKVRRRLLQAIRTLEAGDHDAAIGQLLDTLQKYPDAAPYAHNLLGVAYVKTQRFEAAVRSFEQAALLLPHDATTHFYFGIALACNRDFERAARELEWAVQLEPGNASARRMLSQLSARRPSAD